MDKVKYDFLGGYGLELDDLIQEQNNIRDAFKGILSRFGLTEANGVILSGCEITNNGVDYTIADGYVAIDGEVFKVDSHTVTMSLTGSDKHIWSIEETANPNGNESLENASTVDTYLNRRAKVIVDDPGGNPYMPMEAPRVNVIGSGLNKAYEVGITQVNGSTYIPFNSPGGGAHWPGIGADPLQPLTVYKDINGMVHIQGAVQLGSITTGKICDLPAGLRPQATHIGQMFEVVEISSVLKVDYGQDGYNFLKLTANGELLYDCTNMSLSPRNVWISINPYKPI